MIKKKKTKTIKTKKVEFNLANSPAKNNQEEELIFKVQKQWAAKAYVDKNAYIKKYNHSLKKK